MCVKWRSDAKTCRGWRCSCQVGLPGDYAGFSYMFLCFQGGFLGFPMFLRRFPWSTPGDAPVLQGRLPLFLGGFMPEAVEAARALTAAALGQEDLVADLVAEEGSQRFAFFAAVASLLCEEEAWIGLGGGRERAKAVLYAVYM